jgi:hypothetical protein
MANLVLSFLLKLCLAIHPLYISVVDVVHNSNDKILEITTKIYTDDFEAALKKSQGITLDLINPSDKAVADNAVKNYITNHLGFFVDGKAQALTYIGYEKKDASIWAYFQINQSAAPKNVKFSCNILYELYEKQNNILHCTVGGKEKSQRLSNPTKEYLFNF